MGRLSLALGVLAITNTVLCEAPRIKRAVNASADQFHHRGFQNSVVVGNTLYIDGGEVTTWDGTGDGVQIEQPQADGNILTQPVNFTYSIDLSSSWVNSSVKINTIRPKAAPVVNNEALWLDADNKTVYAYNGGVSQAPADWWETTPPPSNALWEFKPDAGRWVSAYTSPSSIFSSLVRVTNGISAFGNGLGFALGGYQSDSTQNLLFTSLADTTLVPGMVIYDIAQQEWYNVSTTDYTSTGFTVAGAAQFVPPFGPKGLLVIFGGQYGEPDNLQYAQFDYAWMYEPYSKTWISQKVTGQIPAVRNNPCVVGAQGDNGTYEIFLFGGVNNPDVGKTVDLSAIYVLSLPSFTWTKVADPTYGRFFHSCNVINRQMISIGGTVLARSTTSDAFATVGGIVDPWDNGLGVFDMVDLEWKSSFDPSAAAYVTSDAVKSQIEQKGFYPSSWSDSKVEKWFTQPGSASSGGGSAGGSSPSLGNNNGGSSTNVGAIAGGVVGGVLGLALIGALVWFLLRRRRRSMGQNNTPYQPSVDAKYAPVEASGYSRPQEMDAEHPAMELPVRDKPAQPSPGQVHELEGGAWSKR